MDVYERLWISVKLSSKIKQVMVAVTYLLNNSVDHEKSEDLLQELTANVCALKTKVINAS